MRIVGGKFRGRRFNPPAKNWPTRPTTDFAKEGLFNILTNSVDFEDLKVLDLFGGTGNHCYEFISRGCTDVTYVDNYAACVSFVKRTAKELDVEESLKVVKADVFRFIQGQQEPFDYIFADPPYALPRLSELPNLIISAGLLKKEGMLVIEHDRKNNFEEHPALLRTRKYGTTVFSIFQVSE